MKPPCATVPFDFTTILSDYSPHYEDAAQTCETCPLLDWCKKYSLTHDVAGFAAGMLPAERDMAREMAGMKVAEHDFLARLKSEQITPELLDENTDYETPDLSEHIIDVINHWAENGETASQVVKRLPHVDVNGYRLELGYGEPRYTNRTVSWCRDNEMRNRYEDGGQDENRPGSNSNQRNLQRTDDRC